ncbi:MAG: MerR family transcriptional regulator [Clostridia bacterium]|nr:MerR family transcriptional regulator [Clostridia bacterium]
MKETKAKFMTVGELAARLGTTVRTLQYYDRLGLLSPSAASEGGRRLYSEKDMVLLHQILSLKKLGFSLKEIGEQLIPLDSREQVAEVFLRQERELRREIARRTETLETIVRLREEVLQMETVDFEKIAAIIASLEENNDDYRMIKHFDEDIMAHFRTFDRPKSDRIHGAHRRLMDRAETLAAAGTPPEGAEGQAFAAEFWEMVQCFTGGDEKLLQRLLFMASQSGPLHSDRGPETDAFIGRALGTFFANEGMDPLHMRG